MPHRVYGRSQPRLGVKLLDHRKGAGEVDAGQEVPTGGEPLVAKRLVRRESLLRVHRQETADEILKERHNGVRLVYGREDVHSSGAMRARWYRSSDGHAVTFCLDPSLAFM